MTSSAQPEARRRFWGWGLEGQGPSPEQARGIVRTLEARFGVALDAPIRPPRAEEFELPAPRVRPPSRLAALCREDPEDRAAHHYGKSFRDVVRDLLAARGMIAETFETAVTWDAFPALHARVMDAVREAVERICGAGSVACRFTHVYPDGPALYYSVLAPSRVGRQLGAWAEIKAAASEALLAAGGTITHHHAVGREHRPWYDRQRPEIFARGLTALKRSSTPTPC